MMNLALAMGNVEKNSLGQEAIDTGVETGKHQRLNQNSVMDALLRGEITEEVEKLRWRIYKTSSAMKNYGTKVVGYTIDGDPITKITYIGDEERLAKIRKEPSDEYELIMVVDNTNVSASVISSLNLDIDEYDKPIDSKTINIINRDVAPKGFTIDVDDEINNASNIELGDDEIKTIGEVKVNKVELNLPISIIREHTPKFKLENYKK